MNRGMDANLPAGVRIAGTGMAIPRKILTNFDLERMVDTSDEWIVQRTGIRERHIVAEGVTTLDLATQAATQALENAGLAADQLDLVIVATITAEMCCPATACRVVHRLGAIPCGAMDLSMACTGFIGGLNIAANFISTGHARNICVIGAETLSRLTNWKDRGTCILFGDGAGAAIVTASDDPSQQCLYQELHSDGSKWGELYCPRVESDIPAEGAAFLGEYNTLVMNGREIYKFAVVRLQECVKQGMDACNLTPEDVKIVIPHQSNSRILESARDKLGFDEDKVYINIDRYGNTSAASVGICLHELVEAGRIDKGDNVVFVGLGGGLTWGTSVWHM